MIKPYYEEPNITIYNGDCLEVMKELPDKSIDLCLTDPPYGKQWARGLHGIGTFKFKNENPKNLQWDKEIPTEDYFAEIMRVGKNQIIFGGNYFTNYLPPSNCWIVWDKKDGRIRAVGDLLDLWGGKSKDIKLLDNNILALPEHFKLICKQARENNIRLDFNQGLDHKLLNQEIIDKLNSIRHQELHFAWDNMEDYQTVREAIDLLQKNNISRCTWFVLAGFNTTFSDDLLRVKYLKDRNQNAYLMRYNGKTTKELTRLSRWVNNRSWFQAITWEEFLKRNYNLYTR